MEIACKPEKVGFIQTIVWSLSEEKLKIIKKTVFGLTVGYFGDLKQSSLYIIGSCVSFWINVSSLLGSISTAKYSELCGFLLLLSW